MEEGYLFLVRACQGSGDCVIMLIHQTSAKQILIKPKEQRSEATRCEASDWNRLLRNHCFAMEQIATQSLLRNGTDCYAIIAPQWHILLAIIQYDGIMVTVSKIT